MTKDYVKQSPKRKKRRRPAYKGPSVLHILSVFVLTGSFSLGLFYLKKTSVRTHTASSQSLKAHPTHRSSKSHLPAQTGPHFEFYSLLSTPQRQSTPPHNLPMPIVHHQFLLRLATLKDKQRAESLRAQCALMGFKLTVTPLLKDNVTWYRIQTTPFKDRLSAENAQERLREQNIDSMVIEYAKAENTG